MLRAKCALICMLAVTVPRLQWTASAQQQQQPKKEPLKFFGRVEAVDATRKVITVKHGKIPGYMDAMTMDYSVDDENVLKTLHPGDDIKALVYPNDLSLHDVRIVFRNGDKKTKSSK